MELLGLRFLAPGFLALLALPLAALWLGSRGGAVRALVTGTLESWRAAQRQRPAEERRKRRVPPALACLAAALGCAALALARPERVQAPLARRFEVVVDRSPSMYLVEDGRTRLERALEPLRAWAARELAAQDELVWIDAGHPEGLRAREIPAELLAAPRAPLPEPDWPRYDRADALWVGDAFVREPRRAGFAASGARAQPGPVGREGLARLDWDGERIVRVEDAYSADERRAFADARLPGALRELARLWAAERGLELRETRAPGELFAFELEGAAPGRRAQLARDGWRAEAELAPPLAARAGERTWLAADGPCVLAAPGRVRASIVGFEEVAGDPAALAVSFGQLFDACLLAPPGVVPLAERSAHGPAGWRAPSAATGTEAAAEASLSGACALLAALLALGAWVLRGIRA